MKRRWPAVIAVLLVVAAVVWVVTAGDRGGVAVQVGEVTRQDVFRSHASASGEIVPTRYADIGASAMGRVVDLPVSEGQTVAAGDLLARIDPVQAESELAAAVQQIAALEAEAEAAREQVGGASADLEQARARQREAAARYERLSSLHERGLVPDSEIEAARAEAEAAGAQVDAATAALARATRARDAAVRRVAQARAQAARARDLVGKTSIVAPMDGVVTSLRVREGEMVVIGIQNQPGTVLMTVSDLSSINAEVKVAEADVLRVRVGQPAEVTLEALPGRTFPGEVIEVGASALPASGAGAAAREFRVVIRISGPVEGLRPGLTCDAEILVSEKRDVLTVPLQAVVLRADEAGSERRGVFTVDAGAARFVPVRTGVIGGLDIEVEGIEAGTPVVIGPYQELRDLADGERIDPR